MNGKTGRFGAGIAIGTAIGVAIGNVGLGLGLGVMFGFALAAGGDKGEPPVR